MPLKIIGAGYGRTGTYSTHVALNQLGFPCYHMFEMLRHPKAAEHHKFWQDVANVPEGSQHDWELIYDQYTAALDNPSCCVWRELADAYPDAKVLLTLHPKGAETWYQSCMDTIQDYDKGWQFTLSKVIPQVRRKLHAMNVLIQQRSLNGAMGSRSEAVAQYNKRIEEVKSVIAPERLLIYSVDQGWGPLCEFLEVDEPETPFPRANERASTKQMVQKMRRDVTLALFAVAVILATIIGLVWWLFSAG